MKTLRVLDLFSGIGGFSLGLERTGGFETVAFCEIDPFCQKVLKKHWPDVPILEDVRNLDAYGLGRIDVVTGGYPCQPFSTAGKRQGDQDDRHLWPSMFEVIKSIRPTWVIGENVAGHVSMGLDNVLSDLEGEGYTCRPYIIPACAVDAKHRRDRVWIVANAAIDGCWQKGEDRNVCEANGRQDGQLRREFSCASEQSENASTNIADHAALANTGHARVHQQGWHGNAGEESELEAGIRRDGISGREQREVLANTNNTGSQGRQEAGNAGSVRTRGNEQPERCGDYPRSAWPTEPSVGRVANGISRRVDRLKSLGNAVVPQIPEMIGHAILETMKQEVAHAHRP